MAESKLNETFQQIKNLIIEMPLMKKVSIAFTLIASIAAIVFLVELSGQTSFQPVFTGLKSEDMGAVTSALDKFKIRYEIQSETQSVLVPGEQVLEARLKLAKEGLPKVGGVGFELFDQKTFGMTDFEQRLNYQRALQGELIRTINELSEVEDTRIHLVIPERTLFNQTRERPTASVIVKLVGDSSLDEGTIQSIIHLVSSGVANLDPKDVTVVDTNGNLLTSPDSADGAGSMAGYKRKHDVEMSYESKIRSLLEPVVGYNKVQVRVTADLDFTSKETTEEKFDPESIAVRSESRNKNKESSSDSAAGGVPGAANTGGSSSGGGKSKDESNESISYEVSKQVQHIVSPIGEVKKISVAVVVDGNYTPNPDGTTAYAPRTPEEIKNFEDIIKSAIGFDDKRGDQLKVMNLAFQSPATLFANNQDFWSSKSTYSFYLSIIINVIIGIMGLMIILFVIRPLIAAWSARRNAAGGPALALSEGSPMMLQAGQVREELQRKAIDDPGNMVNVLRSWLE